MVDVLGYAINIGDKVVYLPLKDSIYKSEIQIGIVQKIAEGGKSCWCKSVIHDDTKMILRNSKQLLKL